MKDVAKAFYMASLSKYKNRIYNLGAGNPQKIIDLVKALDKNIKYHTIGIRPGEKLHEVLCPEDSARDTIEFKNYYLIRPSIDFTKGKTNNYQINKRNEKGKIVKSNFVYSSDTNPHFLNIKELKRLS